MSPSTTSFSSCPTPWRALRDLSCSHSFYLTGLGVLGCGRTVSITDSRCRSVVHDGAGTLKLDLGSHEPRIFRLYSSSAGCIGDMFTSVHPRLPSLSAPKEPGNPSRRPGETLRCRTRGIRPSSQCGHLKVTNKMGQQLPLRHSPGSLPRARQA